MPMVLDYGLYFSQQFKICVLGNKTLVSTKRGVEVRTPDVQIDETHQFLHDILKRKRVPVNFIDKIIDDNWLIFKLDGSLKTNLKLYLSFRSRGSYLPRLKCHRSGQRFLFKLLGKNRKVWSKLLEVDTLTFSRACDTMNFDAKNKFSLSSEKLDLIKGSGISRAFAFNVHNAFCKPYKDKGDRFIEEMREGYQEMLGCIFSGKPDRICKISHPFYIECKIYNQFVLGECLDNHEGLSTMNERGVRDFISSNKENL